MSAQIRGPRPRRVQASGGQIFDLKEGLPEALDGQRGGGDEETRTPDPLLAKEMLCQLSYVPEDPADTGVVGAPGLEPGTSALSGPRSNQLSYAPQRRPQGGCTDNP